MKTASFAIALVLAQLSFAQDWIPVWSDEFDYTGLPDASKWSYDVGGGGFGNQEAQYYTEARTENASVNNGVLTITARKEAYQANQYTSARLVTRGKGDWLYGKIEVRAKLPKGRGMWPAIWMLPTDWAYGNWPASGELDLMENVGYDSTRVHSNIHTKSYNHTIGTNKGNNVTLADPWDTWHTYWMEWTADSIHYWVDGTHIFSFGNEHNGSDTWPFDKRFHLILNIAVGGSWGGSQGIDDSRFPQSMQVDYVRVFQRDTSNQGGVTPPPVGELIWNGDFSQAGLKWQPVGYYEGAFASGSVENESYHVAITTPGSADWHVQLNQNGLALEQGKTYVVRFKARANAPRAIAVRGNQDVDPWATYGSADFNLTTSMSDYSFVFTMNAPTDNAARIEFDLGGVAGDVWIDEVSLTVQEATSIRTKPSAQWTSQRRQYDLRGRLIQSRFQ